MADRLTRLGPYEIVAPLGTGGMGEVYRARDTRLQRDVAIKVLPASAASNPDRHRRFAQEAIAASALNHPNIVAVYDVGDDATTPYIVSELVEGVSLRQEMQRAMPLKRLLDVAVQIADGLSAAHDAGIVHRDLKPENVMITREGRAKIVDFGLAKMADAEPDAALTHAAGLTETAAGLIMGTAPYMSPEQARGGRVDFRSDQFALGVVVYEIAAGAHPFRRETAVQTLSAIIGDEPPDLARVTPPLPLALRWIVQRLLAKDPGGRYANTADAAADFRLLRDHLSETTQQLPAAAAARRGMPWGWIAAAATAVAAIAAALTMASPARLADPTAYRFTPFATDAGYQGAPAFSPDGRTIAYVAEVDDVLQVFTRSLSASQRLQITRSAFDCRDPFWSPDGAWIYYHSRARLSDALFRVSPAGGRPEKVVDNALRAAISPDGATLASLQADPDSTSINIRLWLSSPPDAQPVQVKTAPFGGSRGFGDGYLRFSPDGTRLLIWMMHDAAVAPSTGPRAAFWMMSLPDRALSPVLPSLAGMRTPPAFTWLPDSRHVVMVRSDGPTPGNHLWVVDTRDGRGEPLTVTNANEGSPASTPVGSRLALTSETTDFDLVFVPLDGSGLKPFLSTTRNELDPVWSPVRPEYAFVTDRRGSPEVWIRAQDGANERPVVTDADFDGSRTMALGALSFSPDGQRLAYQRFSTDGYRIWISPAAGGAPTQLTSRGWEDAPDWSPDGEWIAIVTDDGRLAKARVGAGAASAVDLHVTPVQTTRPRWSPDGRWIAVQSDPGLLLVSADGASNRVLSPDEWMAFAWSADGTTIYGLRPSDDLHHMVFAKVDVKSGAQRTLGTSLGAIPQANQPIRGFSRMGDGGFLTSIARVRSDIWLLDGFQLPRRRFGFWP